MAFVSAKCTNCGGVLAVNSDKDVAICEYCQSPFIIEKAINNYNVTNTIKDSVVHIYGTNNELSVADYIEKGLSYVRIGDTQNALESNHPCQQKTPPKNQWLYSPIRYTHMYREYIHCVPPFQCNPILLLCGMHY